jgi:hypothetical protein
MNDVNSLLSQHFDSQTHVRPAVQGTPPILDADSPFDSPHGDILTPMPNQKIRWQAWFKTGEHVARPNPRIAWTLALESWMKKTGPTFIRLFHRKSILFNDLQRGRRVG